MDSNTDTIDSKIARTIFVNIFEDIFSIIFAEFPKATFGLITDNNLSKLYLDKINE